jgi:hypothetical protein
VKNLKNQSYLTFIKFVVGISIVTNFTPVQAQIIATNELDCDQVNSQAWVYTLEGIKPITFFCDFAEKQPQLDDEKQQIKIQTVKLYWGQPYYLEGNVCRDASIGTICFTPRDATKLRWDR